MKAFTSKGDTELDLSPLYNALGLIKTKAMMLPHKNPVIYSKDHFLIIGERLYEIAMKMDTQELDYYMECFKADLNHVRRLSEITKGIGHWQKTLEKGTKVLLYLKLARSQLPVMSKSQSGKMGGRGNKAPSQEQAALNNKRHKERYWTKFIRDKAKKEDKPATEVLKSQIEDYTLATGDNLPTDYSLWQWNKKKTEQATGMHGGLRKIGVDGNKSEIYTPGHITETAHKVMGGIDLDPASSLKANETVKAKLFFDKDTDGLKQPWIGKIWLNPPYLKDVIDSFIDKLATEKEKCNLKQAIVIVNNNTQTKWAQKLFKLANSLCFPNKRLTFWPYKNSALQGQMIAGIGVNSLTFCKEFKEIGASFSVERL